MKTGNERTIGLTISIDFLLSLPNLMDYITTDATEAEFREYLQELKAEGHEVLPS